MSTPTRPGCIQPGEWAAPASPGAVFSLLQQLAGRVPPTREKYAPLTIVASGHLSVERSMFERTDGMYRDDLMTPAAEEYELSARLGRRRIPILLAQELTAIHDGPTALADICRQQYKHGFGWDRPGVPETMDLKKLTEIVGAITPKTTDSLAGIARKHLKTIAAALRTRTMILVIVFVLERRAPEVRALTFFYQLAIALHFTAGVRDGLSRFSKPNR
jgi:hypothetical protein